MTLELRNNTDKKVYVLENLEDLKRNRLNWCFSIELPEGILDGEYTYKLSDEDTVVATGLLQVGDYKPNNKTAYSGNTSTQSGYIQYNA